MNELFFAVVLTWSVIDGDTVRVTAKVWPNIVVEERIRLAEVDTPERTGRKKCERSLAAAATQWSRERLSETKQITVSTYGKRDSFGRVLGYIHLNDQTTLNAELLRSGIARPYETLGKWC